MRLREEEKWGDDRYLLGPMLSASFHRALAVKSALPSLGYTHFGRAACYASVLHFSKK